jgi:ribosomal-protein-serine acetyltransferase
MRDYVTDGRISIRKYRNGDEFALYEALRESIVELTRWGFYRVDFTMQDAVNDVASRITTWTAGEAYTFLIEELPGPVFLGNCRIEELELERNHASLGWWVRTSKTGKGIATAAGRLVAQAAFEELGLSSLSIYTNADNTASRRVAEKIGAALVRIKPEDDGRYCAVYELKPEYL